MISPPHVFSINNNQSSVKSRKEKEYLDVSLSQLYFGVISGSFITICYGQRDDVKFIMGIKINTIQKFVNFLKKKISVLSRPIGPRRILSLKYMYILLFEYFGDLE